MKKMAYALFASALLLGGASVALANVTPLTVSCAPYSTAFVEGQAYIPFDHSNVGCTFTPPVEGQPTTYILFRGTPGNNPEYINRWSDPSGSQAFNVTDVVFSGSGIPTPGEPYFFAAFTGDIDAYFNYFEGSSATAPGDYSILNWHWGAPATVTADDKSISVGDPLPTFTATISGFIDGDTAAAIGGSANCTTIVSDSSTAGDSPITCTRGTLSSPKYAFDTFVAGTLHIAAAQTHPLTVTANNVTASYGTLVQMLTALLSGFVNGDTAQTSTTGAPDCTTTANASSPVGTYTITCTVGTLVSQNYTFSTFFPGLYTVIPAPLTVTADNKTMVAGSALPVLTATLSGFTNGESPATGGLSGSPSCSTPATSASPAGTYVITCAVGTLSATNYSFSNFVAGTLTVTAPPDTQAPVITITNPLKNGVYAKTESVFLTATVTDASPIATTTYWFGNKKINPALPLPLSSVTTPSIQSVSVSAKDSHGNVATSTLKFFVVKATNSCLVDIISILVLITQDKTFPDKPTLQNLIADCSALLKGLHRYDDDGHHH